MVSEKMSDILARVINSKGLSRQFTAAHVCAVAKEVSGGEFEPASFRTGVLKISVSSPARAHLLRPRLDNFLKKINTELKREMVKGIKIVVKG